MAGVKTATLTFRNAVIDRDLLGRPRWTAFRAEIQRAFDARLVARGIEPGAWEVGDNSADRLSGKELCVLAWLVEQIEGGSSCCAQLVGAEPGEALARSAQTRLGRCDAERTARSSCPMR